MVETLESLAKRLDQMEIALEDITHQLSHLVDALKLDVPENCNVSTEEYTNNKVNKKEATKIINELLEKMGIADVEPIPIEEVRKSMSSRIRAADNEFSRAIIEEREN